MSCAVTLRQSGGSIILSIPKSIAQTMAVEAGSVVELAVEGRRLSVTPARRSLADRLAHSPKTPTAEMHGFDAGFAFGPTRDRSLLASLNGRKQSAWLELEHGRHSLFDAAAREWDGLFQHPALGPDNRLGSPWHRPLDLMQSRLH